MYTGSELKVAVFVRLQRLVGQLAVALSCGIVASNHSPALGCSIFESGSASTERPHGGTSLGPRYPHTARTHLHITREIALSRVVCCLPPMLDRETGRRLRLPNDLPFSGEAL